MAFYQPGQQMRRSYDPPQASQAMTQRAGVGLLFQTSQEGIVVKEVVQSGSAWRSGVIKPGDIIVRVGTVNVQNQPLGNLRELILGEQGTFVTLGFTRGSSQQFYEVKLMRGTAEFLDKHMSGPAGQSSTSQPSQSSSSVNAGLRSGSGDTRTSASNISSSLSKPSAQTSSSAISSQSTVSNNVSAREQDEIERLRSALSGSQAEVARLKANLRSQELLVERNGEELRTYRETLERRDEENRKGRQNEDRSRQEMLSDFKKRFDTERGKLTGALEKSNALSRSLNSVLHNINALQREYAAK